MADFLDLGGFTGLNVLEPEMTGFPDLGMFAEPEPEYLFIGPGGTDPVPEPEPGLGVCYKVTVTILAVLIIVIGTIGNFLVMVVVAHTGSSRTVTDIFLASLALADLVVCLGCSPLLIVGVTRLNGHTGVHYEAEQALFYFSSVASILNLTAIAVDRYDAVTNPMKRLLTAKIAYQLLLIIWAASGLVAVVISVIPANTEFGLLALVFAVPFAAMVLIYRRILRTATQSAERTKSDKGKGANMDKTVRMVMIVLAVFVVSWVPSLISRLLKYILTDAPSVRIARMEVTACLIAYAGSALNFLVYAFMSRKFKFQLYKLLGISRCMAHRVESDGTDIGKTRVQTVSNGMAGGTLRNSSKGWV